MKRISWFIAALTLTCMAARAQDAALEERVNKLNGYLQDLQAQQEAQGKRIEDLAKAIDGLRAQINQSGGNSASADDVRSLTEKLQEIDKKRQADKELILKAIEDLDKSGSRKPKPPKVEVPPTNDTPAGGDQKGFEYTVQSGDTLTAIAQAYREKGVKVTADQIIKANPGLDAAKLKVGKKIFIPGSAQ